MERRFFMNDFEQSLKEHANDFKMVPSKRVWHGIYNDMHPGRRWPSFAVSLLLIFTLVVVGHLNTHNGLHSVNGYSKTAELKSTTTQQQPSQSISKSNKKISVKTIDTKYSSESSNEIAVSEMFSTNKGVTFTFPSEDNFKNNNVVSDEFISGNNYNLNNSTLSSADKNSVQLSVLHSASNTNDKGIVKTNENNNELQKSIDVDKGIYADNNKSEILNEEIFVNNNLANPEFLKYENAGKTNDLTNAKDLLKEKNIDNTAAMLKPSTSGNKTIKFHKKRNENISWTYYAAPVASNVRFTGQAIKEVPASNFSPTLTVNSKPNKVLHNSAFGLEAGTQMNFRLSSKLKFITGLHLTYSGYKIISNEVHPTFATLILKNPKTGSDYSTSYITHYGDGTGQAIVTLRNYSWQTSIPFGLQYEVYGNKKIQFNATANIEPSLVLKNNAYILSSDGGNYVNDPSLLRKWNASSNFGIFVSFKSSKFKWQIGPNIRYQWLSTYQKNYTVNEHLIDYGIRIGISK